MLLKKAETYKFLRKTSSDLEKVLTSQSTLKLYPLIASNLLKMQQAKKDDVLRVRLTSHYRQKLKRFAQKKGITESAVIREYIRRLPDLA